MAKTREKEIKEAARRAVQNALRGAGLTLQQLGKQWGLSESTLSRINNGNLPSRSAAFKIFLASENILQNAEEERRRREEPARAIAEI